MSYQALYRKWRPVTFEDVKGQDHIVTTLKNQIKLDRVGHAYLFCGTRGTGKTTVAKIFAKAVNCENPVDGSPCGECPTCKAIAAGVSMNVVEIDAASNNGVDNIREIRDEVMYSPTEGKKKVYIIDEVHMLSIGAFNALLKTLEEPPEYVIFILATTEASKIPITILSRCQRYDFHRISIDTIAGRLSQLMEYENIRVEDKALRYVAKAADGSMRDALSLIDQCVAFHLGQDELTYENVLDVLGAVDTTVFADTLKAVVSGDVSACLHIVEDVVMQGRDLSQFTSDFVWYLRNLLLVASTKDISSLEDVIDVSADNLKQLAEDAKLADTETLMRYIRVMSDLSNELKLATQKRIKLEVSLIKLCKPAMEPAADIGELSGRVGQLEQQLEETIKHIKETEDKLSDGTFIPAGYGEGAYQGPGNGSYAGNNGGRDAGHMSGMTEAVKPEKKVIQALPEDIKQIALSWDDIVSSISDPLLLTFLRQANVALASDGASLEIVLKSTSAYNSVSREEVKEQLIDLIEERTGLKVNIIVTKLPDGDDFQNRFTDIRQQVNIDIVVDDKEEYI
ncbi:MAG: DNA polymerase III subunit gamma/tau [Clostridia bacterium]|nr:DNA polymerase III subunit gamma/tau [Clostridia bacterium]